MRRDRAANVALFESRRARRRRRRCERYLDSAARRLRAGGRSTSSTPASSRPHDAARTPTCCAAARGCSGCWPARWSRTSPPGSTTRGCARCWATRRSSSAPRPTRAPSMYHLMSWMDLADGVRYPQGGFATLIDAIAALAAARGVRMRTGVHRRPAIDTRRSGRSAARRAGSAYGDADGATARALDADVVVGAADLHHLETAAAARATCRPTPSRGGSAATPARARCSPTSACEGELPELAHHSMFFTRDWRRELRRRLRRRPGGCPTPPRSTCAGPRRPTRRWRRRATRTSSCWCPCRPTPASAAAASTAPATRRSRRSPTPRSPRSPPGPACRTSPSGSSCAARSARPTSPPTSTPGRGGALGPATRCAQSAFLRAAQRLAQGRRAALRRLQHRSRASGLPMCLISAELVLKRLRGDRSTGPLAEPRAQDGGA